MSRLKQSIDNLRQRVVNYQGVTDGPRFRDDMAVMELARKIHLNSQDETLSEASVIEALISLGQKDNENG